MSNKNNNLNFSKQEVEAKEKTDIVEATMVAKQIRDLIEQHNMASGNLFQILISDHRIVDESDDAQNFKTTLHNTLPFNYGRQFIGITRWRGTGFIPFLNE